MAEAARPTGKRSLNGVLNVAKPLGMTSHDVVSFVRRAAGTRRVGHAGTLDPEAAGVLLICLGAATRVSEFLMGGTKRYRAVIRFGTTSTTDDRAGVLSPAGSIDHLTEEVIRNALPPFIGEVEQVPPVFSAIKVAGQPLYRRARAGEVVTPRARKVQIQSIDLVSWQAPDLGVDVVCSKGTYIRSLARDLGNALGTGGYLLALLRTASGEFSLSDSVALDEVSRAGRLGYLANLLYPLDVAVGSWPTVLLPADAVNRIRSGQSWVGPVGQAGQNARGIDLATGRMIALLSYALETGWRPNKVFAEDNVE